MAESLKLKAKVRLERVTRKPSMYRCCRTQQQMGLPWDAYHESRWPRTGPWGALKRPLEVSLAHTELGAVGEMTMFWGVESWS